MLNIIESLAIVTIVLGGILAVCTVFQLFQRKMAFARMVIQNCPTCARSLARTFYQKLERSAISGTPGKFWHFYSPSQPHVPRHLSPLLQRI
jgi:hypothetical protein